jgi:hypothetical protein
MQWLDDASYFLGAAVLANAVPHLVSGLMGRAFQTPFAKPPGQGLSTSTVNVLWAALNLAIAYGLLVRVGRFDIRALDNILASGAGALLAAIFLASRFGRFNGGNSPGSS